MDFDVNICDSGPLFYNLKRILDDGNVWRFFLEAVPPSLCSKDLAIDVEIEGQKPDTTPAKCLLMRLGSKGVTVNMIIQWLEEIHLEKALLLIKQCEPVKITKQPKSFLQVQKGSNLVLTCEATAFPKPLYQWFKENKELLLHQESILTIYSVKPEDAGSYACRVHSFNKDGEVNCVFSEWSVVEIITFSDILPIHADLFQDDLASASANNPKAPSLAPTSNVRSTFSSEGVATSEDISMSSHLSVRSITNGNEKSLGTDDSLKSYHIEIIQHPRSPGKISQGSSIILECKAQSSLDLKYQWHCNGRIMTGETGSKLILSNLYPDPETGEISWYYHCEVSNSMDLVHSHSASVFLDSADELLNFIAEDKIALLIANETYKNLPDLKITTNDVITLAKCLKSIDFKVLILKNLNYNEMKNIISLFCQSLCKNAYGLFYYSGHGFDQFGQSYLQPVDCNFYCSPNECICAQYVLQLMQERNPALNVMLLDSCRKEPPQHRNAKQVHTYETFKPMMKRNTICGYASSVFGASYESDSIANGFFIKHLKKHITKKRCIQDILWMVKQDFETDPIICQLQYPFVGSSLSSARCLTDNIIAERNLMFAEGVSWEDISSLPFSDVVIPIPELGFSICCKFSIKKIEYQVNFCNAIDIFLCIEIDEEESLSLINQVELDLNILCNDVTTKYFLPKDLNILDNKLVICGVIQVSNLEKLTDSLEGTLCMKYGPTKQIFKKWNLSFGIPAVAKLKLRNRNLMSPCTTRSSFSTEDEEDLISFHDDGSYSDSSVAD